WSFLRGPHAGIVEFVEAVPARCALLLSQGEVDGALVPVIEYQRIEGGAHVGDAGESDLQRVSGAGAGVDHARARSRGDAREERCRLDHRRSGYEISK